MLSLIKRILPLTIILVFFSGISYGQSGLDDIYKAYGLYEPSTNVLVDTKWLIEHIDDDNLLILDVRGFGKYIKGHIPGALSVDLGEFSSDYVNLPKWRKLKQLVGKYGINRDSIVVIYDDGSGLNASLLYWFLDYAGLERIPILKDGIRGWEENLQPLELKINLSEGRRYSGLQRKNIIVGSNWIIKNKDNPNVKIIDVRTRNEFLGTVSFGTRAGHIPGAINIPWTKNFNTGTQSFRGIGTLKEFYNIFDINETKTIIVYGQSMLRATLSYFVLKMMGFEEVKLYNSFKLWVEKDNLPVEKTVY